jgi:hypothetical protein
MLNWFKSLFSVPKPAGPPRPLRSFAAGEPTITQGGVRAEQGGWRIDATGKQTIRIFEVDDPNVEQCLLTYRTKLKTEALEGRAFLELWCRLPGRGEFFSKGFHQAVSGTTNWSRHEIPFHLKKGQRPDLIKLNLAVEGTGTVWLRNIELLKTPLAG